MSTQVVILGGGFAGLAAAQRLEKLCPADSDVKITLIDRENFSLFTPLLPEVPSGSIEAKHIVVPLRSRLRRTVVRQAEVRSVNLEQRTVMAAHCPGCRIFIEPYDHLVVALGAVTNFFGLPGVAEQALTMKSLADATALHGHMVGKFEHADTEEDQAVRGELLTFVVVGGGFAGVETAAEMNDFVLGAHRFYHNVKPDEIRVVLVHSGPRILPEVSESFSAYALQKLRRRGVEVLLNTGVAAATPREVHLSDGRVIPSHTLVWTAGVAPNPFLGTLSCPRDDRGRLCADDTLRVESVPGLWALGDCARFLDPGTRHPVPPTAQYAIRQGRWVAENIVAVMRGQAPRPLRYTPAGFLAGLGRRSAVAEIFGMKFSGFFAWWLWRTIYLMKLPGLERKVRVALDWTLDLFFPREIAYLRPLQGAAHPGSPEDRGVITPGRPPS